MLKIKSYAKLNLNLKLVGIQDGYHLLNSVFIPIDLYDNMMFLNSDKDEIIGVDIPMKDNIVYKTLCLIKSKYHINKCVKIIIEKRIPMMGGLGGGSSNAATTLKALNHLWDLKLSQTDLIYLANLLGSDVPFFIINQASYVRGRGQIINPIGYSGCKGLVIFNDAYFKTKDVFNKYDEKINQFSTDNLEFNGKIDYSNDLEQALKLFDDYLKIEQVKTDLKKQCADVIGISGSGGSVFGLFTSDEQLNKAYNNLKNVYNKIWIFHEVKN